MASSAITYVGGINIFSNSNTIGGTAAGAGNVISGNGSDGVDIVSASDNLLQGNLIGTGANGTEPLGNGAGGISAFYGASYNTIGGTAGRRRQRHCQQPEPARRQHRRR